MPDLIILRCGCRDWPCAPEVALMPGCRCGYCGGKQEIVWEEYRGNLPLTTLGATNVAATVEAV